jgi:heme A synthase
MIVAFGASVGALTVRAWKNRVTTGRLAVGLVGLFGLQLLAGLGNLVLLAPIWLYASPDE